jgi:hypothetical protein
MNPHLSSGHLNSGHLNSGHLNNDELIGRLYGVTRADDDSHLENCGACASRQSELAQKRAELITAAQPVTVSSEFLAAQRRRIYARLGQPPRSRMRWVPAFAAACLLAVGVFVYRPAAVPIQHPEAADAQLFSEVYSMAQSTEPLAAEPIHALLEDNQYNQ